MAKRSKPKAPEPDTKPSKPHVVSQLRVGSILTQHGTFLRLMIIETTDGVVTDMQAVNNFFNDQQEIEHLLHGIAGAIQLPTVDIDGASKRH